MEGPKKSRRRMPSAAMIVAVIALIGAFAGGAYAASQIGTSDIQNKAVTSAKIAKKAVKGNRIASDAVKGGKILDGGVKDKKLTDSTQETLADVAGKQDSCSPGAVLAYAQVPSNQSAAFEPIESGFNCTGGTIEARRAGVGVYHLRAENMVFDSTTNGMVIQVTAVGGSGGTITGYGTTGTADLVVNTYNNVGTPTDKLFSVAVMYAGPQE